MAKKIAILNYKGGVSKTTTSVNLCDALCILGKKVLLIDLDCQCDATFFLNTDPIEVEDTIYHALVSESDVLLPIFEFKKNFHFVPASKKMQDIEILLSGRKFREKILKKLVMPFDSEYDYIIYDCPPNGGIINDNAMAAADSIIIPLDSEFLALKGLAKIITNMESIKEGANETLDIEGLLLTKFDSRLSEHKETLNAVKQRFKEKVFNARIRKNTDLAKTAKVHNTIFGVNPNAAGAQDYMQLAKELINRNKRKQKK